jgi:hypothetical protein
MKAFINGTAKISESKLGYDVGRSFDRLVAQVSIDDVVNSLLGT